jgi:NAD(P)-dependent dehydrogenase (short-subunit alcohol dehydrogenase family)
MATLARPVALITGASAGIGAALAREAARTDTISCSSRAAVNRWKHSPPNLSQRVQKSLSSL